MKLLAPIFEHLASTNQIGKSFLFDQSPDRDNRTCGAGKVRAFELRQIEPVIYAMDLFGAVRELFF